MFGEHLLKQYPFKNVAIVESEKTAVICSFFWSEYIWLATGGKSQLNDRLLVLKGRKIVAFPDVDGYQEWKERRDPMKNPAFLKMKEFVNLTNEDELALLIDDMDLGMVGVKGILRQK